MSSDREGETYIHPARVAFHRRINKLSNLSEIDDRVKLALDVGTLHPQDRAIEKNVLATCQLLMETGPNLQERTDPAVDLGSSLLGWKLELRTGPQFAFDVGTQSDDLDDSDRQKACADS